MRDEISYWESRKDSAALQYCIAFQNLSIKLEQLDECSIDQISEFVRSAEDCLDQLWNSEPPFLQNRMQNLIKSIGMWRSRICTFFLTLDITKTLRLLGKVSFSWQSVIFLYLI